MTEMDRLEAFLKEFGYEYERRPLFETGAEEIDCEQIIVYGADGERKWNVIEDRSALAEMAGRLEGTGSIFVWQGEQLPAEAIIHRLENQRLRAPLIMSWERVQTCDNEEEPQASEMRCL